MLVSFRIETKERFGHSRKTGQRCPGTPPGATELEETTKAAAGRWRHTSRFGHRLHEEDPRTRADQHVRDAQFPSFRKERGFVLSPIIP